MSWTFIDIYQTVLVITPWLLSGKTFPLPFFIHVVLVMSFLQESQGGAWDSGLKPVNSFPSDGFGYGYVSQSEIIWHNFEKV